MTKELTAHDWEVAVQYRDMCRKVSTSTEPMDLERAKNAISKLYKRMEWEVTNWITFPSPDAAKKWLLLNKSEDHLNTNFYGSQEAYWIYFLMYARDHLKIELDAEKLELLDIWTDISNTCGWWFVVDENTCIICDRPYEVHLDDQSNLHATDKYAIRYRDGWGVCVVNGLYIQSEYEPYILDNSLITVDVINGVQNAEQRRVLIEIMGTPEYLGKMDMELVSADYIKVTNEPDSPSMPRFLMRSKKDRSQYLVGTDGSTERVYYMETDPEAKTCEEAHNAISPIQECYIVASS